MKQILQSYRTGELWLAEVPVPACDRLGVLVRTRASVVSAGTERAILELGRKSLFGKARARPDLVKEVVRRVRAEGLRPVAEKVFDRLEQPVPLGYSAAGAVVEAGRDAAGFSAGDRVAIAGAGYASHAEFNYVPRNLCVRIPDGVSYADAAFATVGSIALQGVRQAQPLLGERIAVSGLGLLGLLTVQILKANGCAVVGIDPDPGRVALAEKLGADLGLQTDVEQACEAFTNGYGVDAVIIAAATRSNEPIEQAARISRHKGRVIALGVVGMNVPRDAFYRKELDLRLSMSSGPGRYDTAYEEKGNDYPFPLVRFTEQRNMESFLYLVQQLRVTPGALVTDRFPFDRALDAYQALGVGNRGAQTSAHTSIGILLEYGADTALEQAVRAEPPRTREPRTDLGVGFIGAGGFATGTLIPRLSRMDGIRLTAVCTRSGASAYSVSNRFAFEVATTDPEEVLSPVTDVVFVATRHGSHASLAAAALRLGKHVFVEKPLCIRESDLDNIESSLTEARGKGFDPCLMVGFNRRFSPHSGVIRRQFGRDIRPLVVSYRVNAGKVGTDSWIQDPNEGGGRIIGEVCHYVDFCTSLIQSKPTWVTAIGASSGGRSDAASDTVVVTIKYQDGSVATIQYLSEGHRDLAKERCEVFGGGRSAVLEDFRRTSLQGGSKGIRGKQAKGFTEELHAFLDTCRTGGEWPIPWFQIKDTHRVCFAAMRSLATGVRERVDACGRSDSTDGPEGVKPQETGGSAE